MAVPVDTRRSTTTRMTCTADGRSSALFGHVRFFENLRRIFGCGFSDWEIEVDRIMDLFARYGCCSDKFGEEIYIWVKWVRSLSFQAFIQMILAHTTLTHTHNNTHHTY